MLSSVLLNFNDGHVIQTALDALLSQGIHDQEIIIIDDGSTDNSLSKIEQLIQSHPHVRLVIHASNRGIIPTILHGIHLAQGKYLYLGSANDFILPGFFKKAMEQLEANPTAAFCCANAIIQQKGEKILGNIGWGTEIKSFTPSTCKQFIRTQPCHFYGQATLLRTSALKTLPGFVKNDPNIEQRLLSLRWNFDLFLFFALAFRFGFCYLPEAFAQVNISENSFSSKGNQRNEKIKSIRDFLLALEIPEYADTRKDFIQSGLLSFLGLNLPLVAIKDLKFEYLFSKRLISDLKYLACQKFKN